MGRQLLGHHLEDVLHDRPHHVGTRPSVLGRKRQCTVDHLNHRLRQSGGHRGDRARRVAARSQQALSESALARVDRLAAEHTEHGRGDSPQIAAGIDRIVAGLGLFRGDIRDRSKHDPLALDHALGRNFADPCESKIQQFDDASAGDEDVGRFDVPVDDPFRMGVRENLEQLVGDQQGLNWAQSFFPRQSSLERFTVEQLHDQINFAVLGRVVVQHRHRTWVTHGIGRVSLVEKARPGLGVAHITRVQDFDRRAVSVAMGRRINGRHPADIDHAVEPPLVSK